MFKKVGIAAAAIGIAAGGGWLLTRGELVTEVIDGDSFRIANNQVIRLTGLDAPETGFCYAAEAKAALAAKVLHKRVVLVEPQIEAYHRVLALVYVHGQLVNDYLVREGFAKSSRSAGIATQQIAQSSSTAQTAKKGIWSAACYQLSPPNPKCTIKGNINTRTGEKEYLTGDCWYYPRTIVEKFRGEDWFCNISEARKAGFTKAAACPTTSTSPL